MFLVGAVCCVLLRRFCDACRLEGTLLRNRSLEYKVRCCRLYLLHSFVACGCGFHHSDGVLRLQIRLTNDFADYSLAKFADGTFK